MNEEDTAQPSIAEENSESGAPPVDLNTVQAALADIPEYAHLTEIQQKIVLGYFVALNMKLGQISKSDWQRGAAKLGVGEPSFYKNMKKHPAEFTRLITLGMQYVSQECFQLGALAVGMAAKGLLTDMVTGERKARDLKKPEIDILKMCTGALAPKNLVSWKVTENADGTTSKEGTAQATGAFAGPPEGLKEQAQEAVQNLYSGKNNSKSNNDDAIETEKSEDEEQEQ